MLRIRQQRAKSASVEAMRAKIKARGHASPYRLRKCSTAPRSKANASKHNAMSYERMETRDSVRG
jgi:hypothetical protein